MNIANTVAHHIAHVSDVCGDQCVHVVQSCGEEVEVS